MSDRVSEKQLTREALKRSGSVVEFTVTYYRMKLCNNNILQYKLRQEEEMLTFPEPETKERDVTKVAMFPYSNPVP